MDNQYDLLANRIITYLDKNNLGDFSIDEYEEKYKSFQDMFSPELLESMDAKQARDKIFMHDGDRDNLCYLLESSQEYKYFCGSIRGGFSYKFGLFKNKNGKWITGSSQKNRIVNEEESIKIATLIRDAIVEGAYCIKNMSLDSVDDYVKLGKKLNEIFTNCPVNPTNSWIHKYYSIIFPDKILICHNDDMKKNMVRKFHLEALRDFWANDGQLYLLSKKSGIKFYSLFNESIVSLFYKWENNLWTDEFDKHNLVEENFIKYWVFTPGQMAIKEDLCYEKSLMAIGWNYLGDLNQYKDNFDEAISQKIKKTENLKVKPTSALRSLHIMYNDIKIGDIICMRRGLTNIIAVGRITEKSEYYYDESIDNSTDHPYYQIRSGINWFKLDEECKLKNHKFQRDTLYELTDDAIIDIIRQFEDKIPCDETSDKQIITKASNNRNIIYFGAPGTGKSYTLNNDMKTIIIDDESYERVTFHPDYSYGHFVGSYKPVSSENGIVYEYVPGPFMRTLVKSYKRPDRNCLLIIEEINRANVAAVFGDVFQLLDRDSQGNSRYPIEASEDIKKYLEKELGRNYTKITIPSNMFIWATMNSADQGVFPMDSAFKRRWNFRYFGINNNEDLIKDLSVNIGGKNIVWNDLRKAINEELLNYKVNEDKLLGPFFAFDDYIGESIPVDEFKDIFKNKILMYLFEDVARSKRNILFSGSGSGNIIYSKICDEFDIKGVNIFCHNISDQFMDDDEE